MGMIADNMAEVVERSRADPAGALLDLRSASVVEFLTDGTGCGWVNIDGVCALRIQHVGNVVVDTSTFPNSLNKVVKE